MKKALALLGQHYLERSKRELAPYGTFEVYYDSKYRGISRIAGRVGSEARLNRAVVIDLYIARQNNSRGSPRYVTALGLVARLTVR